VLHGNCQRKTIDLRAMDLSGAPKDVQMAMAGYIAAAIKTFPFTKAAPHGSNGKHPEKPK